MEGERTNATEPKVVVLRNAVRVLAILAVSLFAVHVSAETAAAQDALRTDDQDGGFRLEQNYPNPFNPETRIPFELSEELFADGGTVVVSVRIFNILQQFVASPVALGHPGGEGLPVLQLEYTSPGDYVAYWDGRDRNGNSVASGFYFVQMVVNGKTAYMKMFVSK